MKAIVLLLYLIQLYILVHFGMGATYEAKKESLVNTAIQCKHDTDANDSDIKELMNQDLPSTYPGKCMRKCLMEKLELIKDGKISVDGFSEWGTDLLNDHKLIDLARQITEACTFVTDPDGCEQIGKILECLKKGADSRGVDFRKMI